jgi:3-hydroxyisobutyrate dehydrogenase-like beta-hydroxyacid dehydrogenase
MNKRFCIIGFGEAGSVFGTALAHHASVSAYDILDGTPAFEQRIGTLRDRIGFRPSADDAAAGADIILSLVTAGSALDVARQAASYIAPGQVFLDLNSVSPGTKTAAAAAIERAGASYVDGAIMAPVLPRGIAVQILLAGPVAARLAETLAPTGMNLEVASDRVGVASATKMCRSVIIKGIEALCCEAFLAARAYGVEARVLASLSDTFPGTDWNRFAGYQIGRSLVHGRRRAAEMREAARTVSEAGLDPWMTSSTAKRQDWAADLSGSEPSLAQRPDDVWLETLDLILAAGK